MRTALMLLLVKKHLACTEGGGGEGGGGVGRGRGEGETGGKGKEKQNERKKKFIFFGLGEHAQGVCETVRDSPVCRPGTNVKYILLFYCSCVNQYSSHETGTAKPGMFYRSHVNPYDSSAKPGK
jgi:hypothetical protein